MKNKLTDLNNHLFEMIEMVKDGDIDIKSAKAVAELSKNIIEIKKVEILQARTLIAAGYGEYVPQLVSKGASLDALGEKKD